MRPDRWLSIEKWFMDDTESLSLDEKETSTGEFKVAGKKEKLGFICGLHSGEEATGPTPGKKESESEVNTWEVVPRNSSRNPEEKSGERACCEATVCWAGHTRGSRERSRKVMTGFPREGEGVTVTVMCI